MHISADFEYLSWRIEKIGFVVPKVGLLVAAKADTVFAVSVRVAY